MNKEKQMIKIIIALILFLIALISPFNTEINNMLFVIAYVIAGYNVVFKAFRNIIRGKIFDENFLMTIATLGAFGIGEFPEAVAVMLFYQIGEWFQNYAVDKSRRSIANLMDIRPDYANVYRNKKIEKVDPTKVDIGEIIVIKPGEKVPLDGIIIEGESRLNTLALTGEATFKKVKVNDEILSGCVNNDSVLKVKVSKKFTESTVSKILDLVENASSRKSKSENFISKFAKYYTPIVVIIAIFLAIIPSLLIPSADVSEWIYRALAFLVVSCPCALVISVPLSFFGGIGAASKIGVLIKGSNYLEALANTETIVCDKTGTLTEGEFKVQKVQAIGLSNEKLLEVAAYAENYSNHPISLSLKEAYGKEINEKLVSETKEITGKGVLAKVSGDNVLVGNEKLMKDYNIAYQKCDDIGTIIYVAINKTFAGTITIADKIKEDAYKAVKAFRANHVQKIVMLTGDKESVSKEVATHLKLDEYNAELLPQDKVTITEELINKKSETGKVVFIGDGINDAPVLALSDIGVAMGGLGSDAAIEAADVVIMTDEPSKLASAINIAKKTMKIARQNIVFAISVKIVVLILSAIGIATMWAAVFADVGVSVLAILNALRVLRVKNS